MGVTKVLYFAKNIIKGNVFQRSSLNYFIYVHFKIYWPYYIQIMSILNIKVCVKLPQISFTPSKNVTSFMDEPQKKIDVFIILQSAKEHSLVWLKRQYCPV